MVDKLYIIWCVSRIYFSILNIIVFRLSYYVINSWLYNKRFLNENMLETRKNIAFELKYPSQMKIFNY